MPKTSSPLLNPMPPPPARDAQIATETTPCAFCGAVDGAALYDLQDYLYHAPGDFTARRCPVCGLIYLSPRPTRAAITHYYPESYAPYRPAIQDERSPLMRYMRRRKIVARRRALERHAPRRVSSRPATLLDVGCSTGIFLDEMRSAGWAPLGIEINPDAARYARTRFGLPVLEGDLLELDLPAAGFDAITMWDVLEHTFDPPHILARACQLLRPGGLLALTFPSWESLDRRLFGRYWVGFDAPRHLHVFPQPVIHRMLQATGFQVVEDACRFGGYFAFVTSLRAWLRATQPADRQAAVERVISIDGFRLPFEPGFMALDALGWGGVRFVVAAKAALPPGADSPAAHLERTRS